MSEYIYIAKPENSTMKECPICYREYGMQPCGERFLCKDGVDNSMHRDENSCPHYFCVGCLQDLCEKNEPPYSCPLCRVDITEWLLENYYDDSDDDNEIADNA